jgi:ParB family chromosome partitioning protein
MRRTAALAASSTIENAPAEFREIPLSEIHQPTAFANPRTTFDQGALEDLAASIRQHGLLQPVLVRHHPAGTGYELIAGGRRMRAAALAELVTIPARVATLDDQEAREAAIIENLQREDVHPLEEAEAYERCMANDSLLTADAIAAKVGKSPTYVYRRLTLLRLLPAVREAFRNDVITAAHAERLATVPGDRQLEAFDQCFYSLLRTDENNHDRNNLAPMHRLDEWLRTKVALDVHHEDTTRFLPDLAEAVTEKEQAGANVLALSTLHNHTDAREPKPILVRSWKLADGKHKCPHARPGVIVLGDNRGTLLQVCIEKKKCKKHWGAPASPKPADNAERDEKRRAEEERAKRERERIERERLFWTEQLKPALLSAIAEKASHQKKLTRPLMIEVLKTITHTEQLETLCGPLTKLTPDRFPAVLLVALALRMWSQEHLITFAKELRVDLKALRRQLKAARPEDTTAASD